MDLTTQRIKEEARRLGCSHVGIAAASALEPEGYRLREWLARGFHATMGWMLDREAERRDPRTVLPGAVSVVSVAFNYDTPHRHSDDPATGKISRYAWGDDYHVVLEPRLRALEQFIRDVCPGAEARGYCDTGPVMDKAWAVRSGIGWLGKHTNVITRDHGSWVFLGTILTTATLSPDAPIEDLCGTCTACIDACPTSAITQPYVVNATACISYQTIEHRGALDSTVADRLERWVFGCDVCQDVCPWNRFRQPTAESAFEPRPHNSAPMLEELATLTDADFAERFRRSPVKRTKAAGLRRNAKAILESLRKSGHLILNPRLNDSSGNSNG